MQADITLLQQQLQTNILQIEANGSVASDEQLEAIESDYLELLELIKLFLISERDSYYGYFLMNMRFQADFQSDSIAGILLDVFPPVFAANPLLLCRFSLKEILYICCHEIDHVLLNHPAEMLKDNPERDSDRFTRFNLAADAAVNDRIDHEIRHENRAFLKRPDGVITSASLANMFGLKKLMEMQNYAYYLGKIGKAQAKNQPQNGASSMMQQNRDAESDQQNGGTASGQQQDSTQQEAADGQDGTNGEQKSVVTAKSCNGAVSDHQWSSAARSGEDADIDAGSSFQDVESLEEATRQLINAANETMDDESRGLMPGHFLSQVQRINQPAEIPWQKVLKKYIGTISADKRKTRSRLNRRQPERFDLSGSMSEKLLKIVVAIDTSASVDDEMIARIFNEIFAILAKRKHEITVIECDSRVQRVYPVRSAADIQEKVAGRGGTLFTPVIDYINEDKRFRDALLIYFTDGYGEDEIPKPRTYRNMWVVIGGAAHLSLKEPYGVVRGM